jgi:predicted permease
VRIAAAAYRLLLFAFPAKLRREFGDDMAAMFAMQIDEARRGRRSVARLWVRAITDATINGGIARLANERQRASHASGAGIQGVPAPRRGSGRPEPGSKGASERVGGSGGAKPPGSRWRWWMHAFRQDLRYALRVLARQPGVTCVAVLTLALGIGANSAIFSAVNAVLLRPLPYDDPDRLVTVWEKRPTEGVNDNVVSPADFLDWARMNQSFEGMAAMTDTTADLTGSGEPEKLSVGVVSPPFFDILRVRPMLGRTFRAEEAIVGKPRGVILGHHLWTTRYGSDPAIVGRTITLNGNPVEVIGVLPASFEFPDEDVDLWGPLQLEGSPQPLSRTSHQFNVYARLKPNVSLEQARGDMERVGQALQKEYPQANRGHGAWVIPLEERLKGPVRRSLLLLLGAVAFVLLIACVNVANILLAKAAGRRREMAVRSAVGAGRARLAGQMLTESLVLAMLGGAAGLVVAWWGTAALRQLAPGGQPVLGLAHLGLERRVLVFTAILSLATGFLFGFLPAWQLASQDVSESLKDGGRSPGGVRRRLRVALVVSEIALASLLLVAAGLTLRSFQRVLEQPAGFRVDRAVAVTIALPSSRYRSDEAYLSTFDRIEEQFRNLPGVRAVGATSHLPLSGRDGRRGVGIEGREPTPDAPTRAHPRSVTPGYFQAIGIMLLSGRGFTAADTASSPRVAVVNETMARRYWPGTSPVGRRVKLSDSDWIDVVGVIADVKHWGLDAPVNPEIYFPMRQSLSGSMTFVVSTGGDASSLAAAVRDQVRAVDPNLPVANLRTLEDIAAVSVASRRAGMLLIAVFAALALVLAAAGIHGVMSHLVALRSAEIGVRMTLGASPSAVMALVLREGTLQALVGLAIGLTGGVLLMRTFRSVLFGVEPADVLTLALVGTGLLLTALAACAIPARRAMKVDPVTALRTS